MAEQTATLPVWVDPKRRALYRMVDEHKPGPNGKCWWCNEPWLCAKLQRMLLAYFLHNLTDLPAFVDRLIAEYRNSPAFRDMTHAALLARVAGWVEPALAAARAVERARELTTSAVGRIKAAISDYATRARDSWLTPHSMPTVRGTVRYGEVREKAGAR